MKNNTADVHFDKTRILENAVSSIRMGIEDYKIGDSKRVISAVRNFYAGVLLLGKHCLLNAAPNAEPFEVLGTRFEPKSDLNGGVEIGPVGTATIDLVEMKKRFKSFNLSWPEANIKRLQDLRNNLEHFHSSESSETVQQIIAECFPIVEKFFQILELHPADLLDEAWAVMLEEKSFYIAKEKECAQTFLKLSWPFKKLEISAVCPDCGSSLLYQKVPENKDLSSCEIICKACGEEMTSQTFVESLVYEEFGADDYASAKDGDFAVVNVCPECGCDTYIESGDIQGCYFCEHSIQSECDGCGTSLGVNNLSADNSSLCASCDHRFSKDD